MTTAMRGRPQTFSPADGARTLTITNDTTQEENDDENVPPYGGNVIGALTLRGGHTRSQRVAWDEDVVDNEGCGKKKSKSEFVSHSRVLCRDLVVCCIYNKPRRFDESSSEDDSDSDSKSECGHIHDHSSHSQSAGGHQRRDSSSVSGISHEGDSGPNAYEKQPHLKGKRRAGGHYIVLFFF